MPIVVGITAALWILLILAAIGAVLVGVLVMSMVGDLLHGSRRRRAGAVWVSAPLLEVEGDDEDSAVAEKDATRRAAALSQIWTIHPDHTAHWQDEPGACPWCANDPELTQRVA
jgi:hypothetical protein